MDSQDSVREDSEQVAMSVIPTNSPTSARMGQSVLGKDQSCKGDIGNRFKARSNNDVDSGSSAKKVPFHNDFQSPFITDVVVRSKTSEESREFALGELRKNAFSASEQSAPHMDSDSQTDTYSNDLPLALRAPILDRMERASHLTGCESPMQGEFSSLRKRFGNASPIAHEVVRKVSSRSPLDGGAPAEDSYKFAFIQCLELVCEQNAAVQDEAYPLRGRNEAIVDLVFPVPVLRHYSPDFLRHILRHMQLSRRSLATALVYLDRAHAKKGSTMMLCNKNVNVLAFCALVIASRVVERRGYSDEILAMVSGMRDARSLRRSVAYFLKAIKYDARTRLSDTKPYEAQLERMCGSPPAPLITPEHTNELMLNQEQIDSRNRVLKMYYPPTALDL